ncbi:unnamed protein product [Brassica oleracea var. botrytis]|uniref:(rape) hypothetical protein n=1 Tax=Brassica napus TaxID=3708 RepID=A0A816LDI0_BRANA|nr:unnamed protein product [Brassica napus]
MSPTSSLCGDGLFNQSQRIHFIFSSLCPPQPQCFDMIDVSLVISGFRAVRPRFQGLGSGPGGSFTLLERWSGTDVFSSNARRDPVDLVSPAPSLTALVGSGSA